ncbi:hypothetical protein ID853_04790 [Xenorhabdus sp. Vera]|uniref:hypothetical protein n=1 Tax=Xenorhabdus koppenhoeferi TaxID=351659 RepID=UPI0019B6024E|nr:hypothetical protein [Xenorhabdus sp. Vera]MBD2810214.1 hypothetical protein [Xenorhabdus sp. Vera]
MKKCFLLCLLAGSILLVSVQTYAFPCQKYIDNIKVWKACMVNSGYCTITPNGELLCPLD